MKFYLKKVKLLVLILLMITLLSNTYSKQEHKTIKEEVSVNWWQVPIFAIDRAGKPVTDLESEDIEIIVNGGIMPRYTFEKRNFLVSETRETLTADQEVPTAKQVIEKRNKVIFLLFDLSLSSPSAIIRSKKIAEKIIMEADRNTHFFVLTIEPFKGLEYITDGKDNRNQLIWLIDKKVIAKKNRRIIVSSVAGTGGGKRSRAKYTKEEIDFLKNPDREYFKRKFMAFNYSFETLNICLNAIDGNKFIYFLSEGISNNGMNDIRGGGTMYRYYLKMMAQYLSRSGAVLFIINSMGVINSLGTSTSGEESLYFLAQQSGGKYLEGTNTDIVQTLDDIHHAYYEISFPDIPVRKDIPRDIKISSKRKGVSIHTLKQLEKSKEYSEMSDIEKELVAINVVTKNPLFKTKITISDNHAFTTKEMGGKNIYSMNIPQHWVKNSLDLYEVEMEVDEFSDTAKTVKKIKKESLIPKSDSIEIKLKAEKMKNEPEEGNIEIKYFFVLVNPSQNQVYVYRK